MTATGGPGAPVARLVSVTHRYGNTIAADAVSLEMPAGCMVGLIGPDGVGKSTLLALVAGARRIQSGTIEVLGGDMSDARHRDAVCPRIAFMPPESLPAARPAKGASPVLSSSSRMRHSRSARAWPNSRPKKSTFS